jgi:hypothetical protein
MSSNAIKNVVESNVRGHWFTFSIDQIIFISRSYSEKHVVFWYNVFLVLRFKKRVVLE